MNNKVKYIILSTVILIVSSFYLSAQIAVLPPVVYIDPTSNSGTTVLQNQSNASKEVLLGFQYGFISYDANGEAYLDTIDMRFQDYNLEPFVKVFPKKVIIPAYGQQTIRFFVNANKALKDGTYWVRLNVTTRDPKKQIDSLSGRGQGIQVDFRLNLKTNSIVVYPKGNTTTGLKIVNHSFKVGKETLDLFMDYEKSGNTPFWGTVEIDVKDQSGNLVSTEKIPSQIYHNGKVKYSFSKNYFRTGKYTFNIKITGERSEIPENFKIKFAPISKEIVYNFP